MGIRNLTKMFSPTSICILGASSDKTNIGNIVIRNLSLGGFNGPIMPISQTGTFFGWYTDI